MLSKIVSKLLFINLNHEYIGRKDSVSKLLIYLINNEPKIDPLSLS